MNTTYTDEDIERCTMTGRREIVFQLRGLIKQGERVLVTFDAGKQSFLTVLIDVSDDGEHLYFDIGGSEETNRAFLRANHCAFTSVVNGIRIQFAGAQGREATLRGERVLAVATPATLLRLQRRDVFRIQLPSTKPSTCRIRKGTPEELTLPLHDISIGGIGILSTDTIEFEPLEKLENCLLDLREGGTFAVTLEVRYVKPVESRTGKSIWHVGCQFIKLSPPNETLIQRYMARIEAERRSL